MPLGQAALAGIQANGRRWKHEVAIAALASRIGEFNDETPSETVQEIVTALIGKTRRWVERLKPEYAELRTEVEAKLDDLEMVADDLDEAREVMNALYDEFDYYRVVAV